MVENPEQVTIRIRKRLTRKQIKTEKKQKYKDMSSSTKKKEEEQIKWW